MARNPSDTLKDLLLGNLGDKSGDILANTIRDSTKIVILTQTAYDALSVKDSNTLYITVN